MFGSLGIPELALIFIVALIVFGPKRLPEIGRTLGKAMGEFKKATDDFKNTIEREVRVEEMKQLATLTPPPSTEIVSRAEPVHAGSPDDRFAPIEPSVDVPTGPPGGAAHS